jgi:hypothetical protein
MDLNLFQLGISNFKMFLAICDQVQTPHTIFASHTAVEYKDRPGFFTFSPLHLETAISPHFHLFLTAHTFLTAMC